MSACVRIKRITLCAGMMASTLSGLPEGVPFLVSPPLNASTTNSTTNSISSVLVNCAHPTHTYTTHPHPTHTCTTHPHPTHTYTTHPHPTHTCTTHPHPTHTYTTPTPHPHLHHTPTPHPHLHHTPTPHPHICTQGVSGEVTSHGAGKAPTTWDVKNFVTAVQTLVGASRK